MLGRGGRIKARRIPRLVDIYLGRRIAARRRLLGLSRVTVASAIGVSVEQLRRYELGTATVVASRLHLIGGTLHVPIDYFFEGLPEEMLPARAEAAPPPGNEGPRRDKEGGVDMVMRAYRVVADPVVRQWLIDLVCAMNGQVAEQDGEAPQTG